MLHPLIPVTDALDLLILLLLGHFLGDYPLQGDKMAVEKCPGCDKPMNWRWWLLAHSATHGFIVACLTGIPSIGLAEVGAHAVIDYGKCKLRYSLLVDQALHWLCKVCWVLWIALWFPGLSA